MVPPLLPSWTDQVTAVEVALATVAVKALVDETVAVTEDGVTVTVTAGGVVVGVEEPPPPPPQFTRASIATAVMMGERAKRVNRPMRHSRERG
jgi:hypothetical protein